MAIIRLSVDAFQPAMTVGAKAQYCERKVCAGAADRGEPLSLRVPAR